MACPYPPWGARPGGAMYMRSIDELASERGSKPAADLPAGSGTDEIPADISDSRATSSPLADDALPVARAGAGEPPPSLAPGSSPQGCAPHGATLPAGAGARGAPVPAFSCSGEPPLRRALRARHLRPPSGVEDGAVELASATALLLRLVALHDRVSPSEAVARAVAFYAREHVGVFLADAAEELRAERAARHGNFAEKS